MSRIMKRRKFLKYLCSVVPVALVDPSWLMASSVTVPKGAFWTDDDDTYVSFDRFCDDLLIGIVKREGWDDAYVYIKIKK